MGSISTSGLRRPCGSSAFFAARRASAIARFVIGRFACALGRSDLNAIYRAQRARLIWVQLTTLDSVLPPAWV
jgi:hypothetical protein